MREKNYPIYFLDNTCLECGAKAVVPINRFDKPERSQPPLYPIYKMRCQKCGTEYGIRWVPKENGGTELDVPIACSKRYINDFVENIRK